MRSRVAPICAVAIVAVFAAVSDVRGLTWEQTSGPETGEIRVVFAAPGGSLFAGVGNGEIFRSDDGGATWSVKGEEVPNSVYDFAASASSVYAASISHGVYRSDDNGETWVHKDNGMTGGVWSVVVAGATVYAGAANGNAGVYRSDDDGDTWALKDVGLPAGTLVPAMAALGSTVLAATPNAAGSGVYRSSDGGETWSLGRSAGATVGGLATTGSTAYYSARGQVYRSDDDGSTWSDVTNGLPLNPGYFEAQAIFADATSVFVHVEREGIYRSDDGGASWMEKSAGFFAEGTAAVNAFTHDGVALFMGGHAGLYRSADNGDTWAPSAGGIRRAHVHTMALSGTSILAGGLHGIDVSPDGGSSWIRGSAGLGKARTDGVTSTASGDLYAAIRGWPGGMDVYRSVDGGINWTATADIPALTWGFAVGALGDTVYVGPGDNADGLWKSDDSGASWQLVTTPVATVWTIRTYGSDLYIGTGDGASRSADGGLSWETLGPAGFTVTDVNVVGGDIYVTTTTNGAQAHVTTDGGTTWTAAALGGTGWALASNGSDVYAATTTGVYRTGDAGQTWANEGFSGTNPRSLLVAADTLYVGALNDSVYKASLLGPTADVSPTTVNVGVVSVGASGSATFDLTNTGNGLLTVTDIASDDTQCTVAPTAFTLDAGLSQTVTVTYTPTVVGWETATLMIIHDGAGATTVAASGVGSVTPPTGDLLADTRIAISSSRDGNSEIYTMLSDGSDPTRLTTETALDGHPSFSPNGSQIVFWSDRDVANGREVFVMGADGLDPTNLTNQTWHDGDPSWSPDGLRIAFQSDRSGAFEIHTMDPDGLNVSQVTNDGAAEAPQWSPDSSKLVYTSGYPGDIIVVRADGSDAMNLTDGAIAGKNAVWAPDGAKIAFAANTGSDSEIYTIGADGSNLTNLTNDAANDTMPYWSPDGTTVAFTSDRSGDNQVYVMDAGGGVATQLTAPPGVNDAAMWSAFLSLGDVTLTVANAQGQIGSVVTVPIDVTSVEGLAVVGIELTLTYDATLLTPQDDGVGNTTAVTRGDVIPPTWTLLQHVPAEGELKIAMAGEFATPATGEGEVVSVVFDISASATAGATSALSLTQTRVNEGVITSAAVDGAFTVLSLVYGDVTGNGDVSALDAAWVLEHVANTAAETPIAFPIEETAPTWAPEPLTPEDALEVADVDDDGTIMALDASEILKFLVGLIPNFAAEGGAATAPSARVAAAQIRMEASATAYRPGGVVTVSLDTSGVADLYAGELTLEYDARVLRPVDATPAVADVANADDSPLLVYREGDGVVGVAFASARPIDETATGIDVAFEIARNLPGPISGVIRASHVRLNRTTLDAAFTHRYDIRPYEFTLYANYPNPFNPETWIPFELSADSDVVVSIYALDGRRVRSLDLGARALGEHTGRDAAAYWNGRNDSGEAVASGTYIYELRAGADRSTRRMVLLK